MTPIRKSCMSTHIFSIPSIFKSSLDTNVTVHGKTYLNAYPLDKQKR